jgi:hypothetical protein
MTKITLNTDLEELTTELDKLNIKAPEMKSMGGVFTQIIRLSESDDEGSNGQGVSSS